MLQAYNYDTGAPIAAKFGEDAGKDPGKDPGEDPGKDLGKYMGPAEKNAGGNFQCNDSMCWPIGKDVSTVFADLQRQANRFAAEAGFDPIAIDTFIGPTTLAAVNGVIRVLASASNGAKAVFMAGIGQPGYVAAATWAAELAAEFKVAADARKLPPGTGPIVGHAVGQPGGPKPGPTYKRPDLKGEKTQTVWWVLAGLALLGASVVGYTVYKRSKKTPKTPRVRAPAFAR
jgi:hypothetical protein